LGRYAFEGYTEDDFDGGKPDGEYDNEADEKEGRHCYPLTIREVESEDDDGETSEDKMESEP
jgi:hypothetical protein